MSMTILDVAVIAGTSKSTVSRYLNGESVSPRTAEKIRSVIHRVGYCPNVNARRLVKNKSLMLGVIFDDIANYTYGDMLDGVQKAARAKGYDCLFLSRATDQRPELAFLDLITSSTVDGLILITFSKRDPKLTQQLAQSALPVVLVGDGAGADSLPRVDVDNQKGTLAEIEYLIGLGHTRIAYLKGPDDMPAAHAREKGYLAALEKHGIEPDPSLIVQTGWSVRDAYQPVKALAARTSFTALAASNAYAAYGSFLALTDLGMKIPDDVALAGFDDDPLLEFVPPGITTMRQPLSLIGARAVETLMNCLNGSGHTFSLEYVQPALIERGSTVMLGR